MSKHSPLFQLAYDVKRIARSLGLRTETDCYKLYSDTKSPTIFGRPTYCITVKTSTATHEFFF